MTFIIQLLLYWYHSLAYIFKILYFAKTYLSFYLFTLFQIGYFTTYCISYIIVLQHSIYLYWVFLIIQFSVEHFVSKFYVIPHSSNFLRPDYYIQIMNDIQYRECLLHTDVEVYFFLTLHWMYVAKLSKKPPMLPIMEYCPFPFVFHNYCQKCLQIAFKK